MPKVRDVLGSGLTRFLPGAVGLLSAVLAYDVARGAPFLGDRVLILLLESFGLVVGYTAAARFLRARLRADAQIHGRRSVIAGIVAAAASYWGLMVLENPWHDMSLFFLSIVVAGVVAGIGGTLAVFFPWLTARNADSLAAGARASPNEEL